MLLFDWPTFFSIGQSWSNHCFVKLSLQSSWHSSVKNHFSSKSPLQPSCFYPIFDIFINLLSKLYLWKICLELKRKSNWVFFECLNISSITSKLDCHVSSQMMRNMKTWILYVRSHESSRKSCIFFLSILYKTTNGRKSWCTGIRFALWCEICPWSHALDLLCRLL